jgi:hypothetical protein
MSLKSIPPVEFAGDPRAEKK